MAQKSVSNLASVITRAGRWTPSLEHTLHQLGCRYSLSPILVARVIDPFLLNHHSLALGFFNWASQQPSFSHTSASYQSILKSLTLCRQFNTIENLLKQVRAQNISLHPAVYRSVITSLVTASRTLTAFSIFIEVGSIIPEIGPQVCNSLLAALSSEGSTKSAHKVFDEMINKGVQLNTLGFGVFVWWACRKTELSGILSLIDNVRKIGFSEINGSVIALFVIHGLCVGSRANDAIFALEELRNRECKPDFMAYRIVAESLREMGYVAEVEMILKKKRKLGVSPRANDYRVLILQFVSERLIREAKELSEIIVSGDFPIEDDVLNVLIGSVSASDPLYAISLLKFMLEKEKLPTSLTLVNLCENLCNHKKGEELVEVLHLLSQKDYFKNLECYNLMVSFLCKGGRVREGYQLLQKMRKEGLCPDVSSYNSLLEACCREDLVRPAKRLWDEMFASGCCANLESYNIVIKRFSELGQVEDACHLFYDMIGKGVEPNELTYKSLLQGLCEAKELETALQVFNKLVELDGKLANVIMHTFVHCLCKEGFYLPACKLLRDQLACGVGCVESHLTLLRYLGDVGEVSLASEHVKWIARESPAMLHAIQPQLLALHSSSS